MQSKNRTTLFIETEIMNTIKQIANNKKTTQTEIINDYLKKGIEQEPEKNKIHLKVLVQSDPNVNIDDLIGTVKAPKGFDPVEAVREVRLRKG